MLTPSSVMIEGDYKLIAYHDGAMQLYDLSKDISEASDLSDAMPERVGVAAIPASAFYQHKAAGRHLVRFAFCKSEAVLDEGLRRLRENISRLR